MSSSAIDFSHINVMGILNITPDSFSDGGLFVESQQAVDQAKKLIHEGADILDIGGESTRPGASHVGIDEELERTIPVIHAIRQFSDIPISIDTSKPEVMREAAAAGASMINDVWALRRPGALQAAVDTGLPVCLMHMLGEPGSMQQDPRYVDVEEEVKSFLQQRLSMVQNAGIPANKLLLDPGFGFGKNLDHNLALLRGLHRFSTLGFPLLVGLSRKSMLGVLTGKAVGDRLYASLSAAVIAAMSGATILRVHDVAETRDAIAVVKAVKH
jgi:dihydropteroate synthase